ncbi:MAG: tRNA modification GTPase, partial [Deferrisomatales bacterium]
TGVLLDQVLALWMPGPASYTREDVLEIHCHGGHAAARGVLETVLAAGARLAAPGEFTLRAYLRGRLDLVQAEAVLDVIRARTDEALQAHAGLLAGRLSREVEEWQEALAAPLAYLEAHLDFPDEDLGEPDPARVVNAVEPVARALDAKLGTFAWGRAVRDGFAAVLVGSPNTGKSSLLNRLCGRERAIVSPRPGTTRDTVEVWLDAGGVPVRLVDTAGLRDAGEDEAENEGVRRARAEAEGAGVVVFVCDGSRGLTPEEVAEARALVGRGSRAVSVVNKCDLGTGPAGELERVFGVPPLAVSARSGHGIPELVARLRAAAWAAGPSPEAPLTRLRHRDSLEAARGGLGRAIGVLASGGYLEVAASELHGARRSLGELLGHGSGEEVLDLVFREFCIGK